MKQGLILFAHGARDPGWAKPFEDVCSRVDAQVPERQALLAFLEFMHPDLAEAVATQVERGFGSIRIVPLFLGPGGHLRHELPRLVDAARHAHPGVAIEIAAPAGEDPRVIEALAAYSAG